MSAKVGYIRSSRKEQKHTASAQEALLRASGFTVFFKDEAVASDLNLTEGKGWLELQEYLSTHPATTVGVTRQDRFGREWDLVNYAIGQLIRSGHSLQVLDPDLTIDSLDDLATNFRVVLTSVTDKDEKTRIRKRTNEALSHLKASGVWLGPKPLLTRAECDEIRRWADEHKMSARALSRELTKERLDSRTGKLVARPLDVKTIRRVLTGEYVDQDTWVAHNEQARAKSGLRLSSSAVRVGDTAPASSQPRAAD